MPYTPEYYEKHKARINAKKREYYYENLGRERARHRKKAAKKRADPEWNNAFNKKRREKYSEDVYGDYAEAHRALRDMEEESGMWKLIKAR